MEHRATFSASFLRHIEKWAEERNLQVPHIQGNVSAEVKRQCWFIFQFFVNGAENAHGANVGLRLRFLEANIRGHGKSAQAGTVYEIMVREDMCNAFSTLHGACATYIIDLCSASSLVVLGVVLGFDGTGVSQSMNIIWHQPVRLGETITVKSSTMYFGGRLRTTRCELWSRDVLCISATHSIANPSQKFYDSIIAKL
ncbi:hypothetical protein CPC08DRAFT_634063 [Agrocybe pediades]|nr:hypothetical protein CPC08DRAFT_634063 [Agrocybe pediades]